MPRTFLFMRHGESTANVKGICAGGDTAYPLTETGRAQAKAAAKLLRRNGITPDHIVHSLQHRAAETAELIGLTLGIESSQISGNASWRERGFGEWEGAPFADIFPHLENWTDPPGGEPLPVLFDRVSAGLEALPNGLTLLVSHGGIWHVLNKLHGVDPAPHIGNAEVFEVVVDGGRMPSILTKPVF
jgi:probable phosphoglycerate mutase